MSTASIIKTPAPRLVELLEKLGLEEHIAAAPPATDAAATDRWVARCFQLHGQRLAQLPAGRYAVERDGGLRFFRVDRPTEGRWAGHTFVKAQAGDDLCPLRDLQSRDMVLREIAWNAPEAMLRYGREIGACGHCGRTLTNDESRARGIGPVCAGKMGW